MRSDILKHAWPTGITAILLVCMSFCANAQEYDQIRLFKVKDNKMWIVLSRNLPISSIDSFILNYNLRDIGLSALMRTGNKDSLVKQGWTVETEEKKYIISKLLGSVESTVYPAGKIIFTPVPTPDETWREVGGNRTTYGFNRFHDGQEFRREKNIVYFHLKGFKDAKRVRLAGNFTNWQHAAFPMIRTEGGWTVQVKLEPGQYYYKFIVGDNGWTTDPANELTENDGRGNENSMYFVPNQRFLLKNHHDAWQVFLSGTFNNWARNQVPLKKTALGWSIEMYIEEGTYDYHYVVDGKVVKPDGSEEQKLAIGKPHLFELKEFPDAKKVILAGNFNDWKEDELKMKKNKDGWELKYVLGPGNYQYKFIVDGRWMVDPSNPRIVKDNKGNQNSFMVIGANYTFRLKGHADAKNVAITGDFTNYSPDGIRMERVNGEWEARVYLAKGKHRYNYIVDGEPMRDPANKAWELDERRTKTSVLWIDPNQLP